jgi:hypothetical protein
MFRRKFKDPLFWIVYEDLLLNDELCVAKHAPTTSSTDKKSLFPWMINTSHQASLLAE